MEGPNDEFRLEIGAEARQVENENQLDEVLAKIESAISADLNLLEEDPQRMFDAVTQWASIASYAVGGFYGPASRWSRDEAGLGRKAVERLRRIASLLSEPLKFALSATGASSFSISVGFPWGISVGLSWG